MAVTTELSLTYNHMENIYSFFSEFVSHTSLKIQIRNRSHTSKDRQIPKRQTVKTLHRKLKIGQHESH